jgi:Ribonuclease G/E
MLHRVTVEPNNESEDILECSLDLNYHKYIVIKETEHFYYIKVNGKNRKVGKNTKAAFARTNIDDALMDAWHRSNRHRCILNARIAYADKVSNFLKSQINDRS